MSLRCRFVGWRCISFIYPCWLSTQLKMYVCTCVYELGRGYAVTQVWTGRLFITWGIILLLTDYYAVFKSSLSLLRIFWYQCVPFLSLEMFFLTFILKNELSESYLGFYRSSYCSVNQQYESLPHRWMESVGLWVLLSGWRLSADSRRHCADKVKHCGMGSYWAIRIRDAELALPNQVDKLHSLITNFSLVSTFVCTQSRQMLLQPVLQAVQSKGLFIRVKTASN